MGSSGELGAEDYKLPPSGCKVSAEPLHTYGWGSICTLFHGEGKFSQWDSVVTDLLGIPRYTKLPLRAAHVLCAHISIEISEMRRQKSKSHPPIRRLHLHSRFWFLLCDFERKERICFWTQGWLITSLRKIQRRVSQHWILFMCTCW